MSNTKVMTLNTIVRTKTKGERATRDTPAVPPVTETIKPFTIINVSSADLKDLLAAGAVTTDIDGRAKEDLSSVDEMSDAAHAEAQKRADEAAKAKAEADKKAAGSKTPSKTDPLV